MKIFNLKLQKEKVPQIGSLRTPFFDLKKYWFWLVVSVFLIFIITFLVGSDIFYSVYSENYKTQSSIENADSLINLDRIKQTIQLRENLQNSKAEIPHDPSI